MKDSLCTGAWIETYTGKKFELLDPKPDQICIEDIARALSQQCRFTGHTKRFYSVAEHCWHVSFLSRPHKLGGLLHDASEAYLSDLSRPVKQLTPVGAPYLELEAKLMRAISLKFGIVFPMPDEVKKADNALLFTEKEQLMTELPWGDDTSTNKIREKAADIALLCWSPEEAEKFFLERFEFLTEQR